MLTKEEKNEYREELFRHLDGIAVAPVAFSLKEKGVNFTYRSVPVYNSDGLERAVYERESRLEAIFAINRLMVVPVGGKG